MPKIVKRQFNPEAASSLVSGVSPHITLRAAAEHASNRIKSKAPPRGGYSSEFLVGVCRPVPQILTQFQTKIFNFPYPFSDLKSLKASHQ